MRCIPAGPCSADASLLHVPAERRTKIVATIGPVSSDEATLASLVDAGMDGVRLNFSHGAQAEHETSARRTRAVQAQAGRPLALIADLQGPKIRIGELEAAVELEAGDVRRRRRAAPLRRGRPSRRAGRARLGSRGGRRDPHRRRQRPAAGRPHGRRAGRVRGRNGRRRRAAQGRERPWGPASGPVVDREGSPGSRLRARARGRLRGAVVRPHAPRRRGAQVADRGRPARRHG